MQKVKEDYLTQLNKALDHISNGEFSEALALYNHLKSIYEHLPKDKQTEEIKQKTALFYNELRLYLHLNEAEILAQKGDPVHLRKALKLVEEIADYNLPRNLPKVDALKKYAEKEIAVNLVDCQQVLTLKDFTEKLAETESLITHGHLEKARENFSNLLLLINRIPDLDKKTFSKLHIDLEKLYKRLAYPILIKNVYTQRQVITPEPTFKVPKNTRLDLIKEKVPEVTLKPVYPVQHTINRHHPLYHLHEKVAKTGQIQFKSTEILSDKAKQIISETSEVQEKKQISEPLNLPEKRQIKIVAPIKTKMPSFEIKREVPKTKIEDLSPYCEFGEDFENIVNSLKHNDSSKAKKLLDSVS